MAEEELSYGLTLADHMSGPANAAATSLEHLQTKAHGAQGGLVGLAGGLLKTIEPTELLRHAFEGAEKGLSSFAAAATSGDAKGAVEGLTETLAGLAQLLDLVVPGLGQLASAAIKAGGAFASMTVGLLQSSAELALEQTSLRERLEETFEALGDAPGAGAATLSMLDDLSSKLPQSRAELAEWTKTYEALGITDLSEVQHQLLATASAQAIMGDKGAQAYEHLTKKIQTAIETHQGLKIAGNRLSELASAGVNVASVAEKMGLSAHDLSVRLKAGTVDAQKFGDALSAALVEKGAGPLASMGGELSTQLAKAREMGARLFDSVDAKPFLLQMRSLLSILDQTNPSGQAAKAGITGLLEGTFTLASKALPPLKHFFLGLEIGGLRAYIALKPAIKELHNLFGGIPVSTLLENHVRGLASAIEHVAMMAVSAVSAVTKLLSLGKQTAEGLAHGLTSGGGVVSNAAKSLAEKAEYGVKAALGIQSPSRVMITLGHFTASGLASGITAGAPTTERAAFRLGTVATAGVARSRDIAPGAYAGVGATLRASAGLGRGSDVGEGRKIVIERLEVHAHGGAAATAMELTETAIATMMERLALTQGL